jgi:hypothetical protein
MDRRILERPLDTQCEHHQIEQHQREAGLQCDQEQGDRRNKPDGAANRRDGAAAVAICDLTRHEEEAQSGEELQQADHAEREGITSLLIDLPTDRNADDLLGKDNQKAGNKVIAKRNMLEGCEPTNRNRLADLTLHSP